jgi:hypothetical protein
MRLTVPHYLRLAQISAQIGTPAEAGHFCLAPLECEANVAYSPTSLAGTVVGGGGNTFRPVSQTVYVARISAVGIILLGWRFMIQ